MKGQSDLIAHTILIAFTVTIILFVVQSVSSINNDYRDFIGEMEANEVCYQIKNSVLKLEHQTNVDQQIEETIGSVEINLPDKIGDRRYRINSNQTSLTISLFSGEDYTCEIGFTMTGQTVGGLTTINRNVKTNEDVEYELQK